MFTAFLERERKREKNIDRASCIFPSLGMHPQSWYVPWPESILKPFGAWDATPNN